MQWPMKLKNRIRIFFFVLGVGLFGSGMYVYQSVNAQLAIQVAASNHMLMLLPVLPKEMAESEFLTKYPLSMELLLKDTKIHLVSHEKKTNHTGKAVMEITVPILSQQVKQILLAKVNNNTSIAGKKVTSAKEIDYRWVLDILEEESKNINLNDSKKIKIVCEVSTFATKSSVWSFSADAIEDAVEKVLLGMGFNSKWQQEIFDELP